MKRPQQNPADTAKQLLWLGQGEQQQALQQLQRQANEEPNLDDRRRAVENAERVKSILKQIAGPTPEVQNGRLSFPHGPRAGGPRPGGK